MKCKHHKKHYDEKRNAHLRNIETLEANLASKDQELQVWASRLILNIKSQDEPFITDCHQCIISLPLAEVATWVLEPDFKFKRSEKYFHDMHMATQSTQQAYLVFVLV